MGRPKFTSTTAPSLRRSPSPSNTRLHPSIDRPHSLSQTTSGSNQPFCHSKLSRPTDRPTHRPTNGLGDRYTPISA